MDARRRLGLARIYWRNCAAFHFAHKPLCAQFRSELLRCGPLWLCRSCCWLWLGIAAGSLTWLILSRTAPARLLAAYAILLSATMLLSLPSPYKRLPRMLRDLLRFSAGLCIALAPYIALRVSLWAGLLSILAILLFRHFYLRSSLRRRLSQCRACPASSENGEVCEGFALQRACLSRYQNEATEYLYQTGYVPPGLDR